MVNIHESEESAVKYGGLSNAEIMMVYFRFKSYLKHTDENLNKRRLSKVIDTPLGKATVLTEIPESHVTKFRDTEFYKLTKNIVEKLDPVVELILECDESYQKLADELR